MPHSSQFDVLWLDNVELPFDRTEKELSNKPRLVDGQNMYITPGGKLAARPGFTPIQASSVDITATGYISRLWVFRTIESTGPGTLWYVASVRDTGTGLYNLQATDLSGNFAQITDSSSYNLDDTDFPHEAVVFDGKLYVRYRPTTSSSIDDPFGSVVIEENTATNQLRIVPWGVPQPFFQVTLDISHASTSPTSVLRGWRYAYAFEHINGSVGNRVFTITPNSGGTPSNFTGALSSIAPWVSGSGHDDVTNFPTVRIYRTTDGGGTYYFLDSFANPGTGGGNWEYQDIQRDGTAPGDPKLDLQLNFDEIAPDEISNSAPPVNGPDKLDGAEPAEEYSNVVVFARRIWYAIKNHVFFSGQEEIYNGIPQHCFPNPKGLKGANRYTIRGKITGMASTRERNFIFMEDSIGVVRGEDRTNLRYTDFSSDVGMPDMGGDFRNAVTTYRDSVFYVGRDFNAYGIAGDDQPTLLSEALNDLIKETVDGMTNPEGHVGIFTAGPHVWLTILIADRSDTSKNRMFVFDLKNNRWFTPWTVPASTLLGNTLVEGLGEVFLVSLYSGGTSTLAYLDFDASTDDGTAFVPSGTTNLFTVPAGNHINALREPAHHPMVSYLIVERTKFTSDTAPTIQYRLDEFDVASFETPEVTPSPFLDQKQSYNHMWMPIQKVCKRVQLKFTKSALDEKFEIQNLGFVFQSEAGA